jgi:hypothetical protein
VLESARGRGDGSRALVTIGPLPEARLDVASGGRSRNEGSCEDELLADSRVTTACPPLSRELSGAYCPESEPEPLLMLTLSGSRPPEPAEPAELLPEIPAPPVDPLRLGGLVSPMRRELLAGGKVSIFRNAPLLGFASSPAPGWPGRVGLSPPRAGEPDLCGPELNLDNPRVILFYPREVIGQRPFWH